MLENIAEEASGIVGFTPLLGVLIAWLRFCFRALMASCRGRGCDTVMTNSVLSWTVLMRSFILVIGILLLTPIPFLPVVMTALFAGFVTVSLY